jgi:hypothetical protein
MTSRQKRNPCGTGTFTWPQMSDYNFMRGRGGFAHAKVLRGVALALLKRHESHETFFTELGRAGEVKTPL